MELRNILYGQNEHSIPYAGTIILADDIRNGPAKYIIGHINNKGKLTTLPAFWEYVNDPDIFPEKSVINGGVRTQ